MADIRNIIHLDLKGFPPTPDRLLSLIPEIRAAGFRGILFEFSDMFPWQADARFRNETAYPEEVVSALNIGMERNGLETWFLLDIFHGLEYMLGVSAYRFMAINEADFGSVNPFSIGSRNFLETLMDDAVTLLPGMKRIILGGTTVLPEAVRSAMKSRPDMALSFITSLCGYTAECGVQPLFGESLLSSLPESEGTFPFGLLHGSASTQGDFPETWTTVVPPSIDCARTRRSFDEMVRAAKASIQNPAADAGKDEGSVIYFPVRATHSSPQCIPFELFFHHFSRASENTLRVETELTFETPYWDLHSILDEAWDGIREARCALTMATIDSRRRYRHAEDLYSRIEYIRRKKDAAEISAARFSAAVNGLLEPLWVDRFIRECIEPIREEIGILESRLPSVSAE